MDQHSNHIPFLEWTAICLPFTLMHLGAINITEAISMGIEPDRCLIQEAYEGMAIKVNSS